MCDIEVLPLPVRLCFCQDSFVCLFAVGEGRVGPCFFVWWWGVNRWIFVRFSENVRSGTVNR